MARFFAFLLVVLLLPLAAARAEAVVEALEQGVTSPAVEVVDGDTLLLENGTEVRLVGIQAPELALGRAGFKPWPLAEQAKQGLEALALGKMLTLYYGGRKLDRYGRALAHLLRADGLWLQGELLAAGMARVYSFRDNRRLIAEMLGSFQLVEGPVVGAAIVRRRGYLNFGADWKSDFTISIAPGDRKLFGPEGEDTTALEGRTVRVRGWIKSFNGAMIEATHPEQIEVFE